METGFTAAEQRDGVYFHVAKSSWMKGWRLKHAFSPARQFLVSLTETSYSLEAISNVYLCLNKNE